MEAKVIDNELISELRERAKACDRRKQNYDLRTTEMDTSQRLLNVLEPGAKVAIHRHQKTTETAICLTGCLEWVFYAELPNMDAGGPIHDGEKAIDESNFVETVRVRICPREGKYGIQVPQGIWHSVEVYEPSTIFEAKDGAYKG